MDASSGSPWVTIVPIAIALTLLVVAVIPIVKWARHRSRMRRLDDGDISAAWEEIVVRLTDFGVEPDPAATPTEVAESVDHVMKPLASVYSRSIYGSAGRLSSEHTDTARQSMQLTSDRFVMSHSTIERFLSYYRLASLRRRFR
jgi:hypothetical protein